jgi:hypothetical protein
MRMRTNHLLFRVGLTFAAITALASAPAHATYKCVDDKGVTHYGDTMPPQCASKPVTEMSKQGAVVRKYDAPLTPEQLKARQVEEDKRKEENKRIAEQKLRDMALIATYGSEREFDMARDKDLAAVDARKKILVARSPEVDQNLTKVENEMEFYRAGKSRAAKTRDGKEAKPDPKADPKANSKTREAPPQLVQDYNRVKNERATLDAELTKTDHDRKEIVARYDSERARWKKLKAGMAPGTLLDDKGAVAAAPAVHSQIVGQSTIIPGQPRGAAQCNDKTYECSLGIQYICRGANIGGPGINSKLVRCNEVR